MKVTIYAYVFVPPRQMYIGGTNHAVAEFSREVELELTPSLLDEFINKKVICLAVAGVNVYSNNYSLQSNLLGLKGHLASTEPAYLANLRQNGWRFDPKAAEHHRLEIPF